MRGKTISNFKVRGRVQTLFRRSAYALAAIFFAGSTLIAGAPVREILLDKTLKKI